MSEHMIIDCFGHSSATSLDVQTEGGKCSFLFDDEKPAKLNGHIGLYLDYRATAGRDYLRYPKSRRVALLCEPNASLPFVAKPQLFNRFCLILTHDARLLERGEPYVEMPFGTSFVESVLTTHQTFPKTRMVSMIGAPHPDPKAGHVLRNEVIEKLRQRSDVDLFGKGIRWIDSKLDGLQEYGFSIAMENCDRDFYFSEKIIDCLLTDTVPIYFGCSGITRYFDPRGLLFFESLSEILEILDNLTWQRYAELLPFLRANRERAMAEGWATRSQLFGRVATSVRAKCGDLSTIARSTLFREVQDGVKVLRQRFSKRQDENS